MLIYINLSYNVECPVILCEICEISLVNLLKILNAGWTLLLGGQTNKVHLQNMKVTFDCVHLVVNVTTIEISTAHNECIYKADLILTFNFIIMRNECTSLESCQ